MLVLLEEFALVVRAQTTALADPVTLHVIFPVGATEPVGPVTVALIVSLPPSVGATGTPVRVTEGTTLATLVVVEEVVEITGL
jgi:hypothetical protein